MTDFPRPTKIDQAVASKWLHNSLSRGSVISSTALKVVQEREGYSYTLVPDTVDATQLANPSEGGVVRAGSAREALVPVLSAFAKRGAVCVVVEDEVRRQKDPRPSVNGPLSTAFIDHHVLHWAGLTEGAEPAIQALHRGSHGYPLNAFATSASEEELGLVDGADLNPDIGRTVIRSLVAVIVAAYDAETFLIWEPGDGSAGPAMDVVS